MEFFFTLHCCWRRHTLYTEGVAGNKNDAIMTCYFKRCELIPSGGPYRHYCFKSRGGTTWWRHCRGSIGLPILLYMAICIDRGGVVSSPDPTLSRRETFLAARRARGGHETRGWGPVEDHVILGGFHIKQWTRRLIAFYTVSPLKGFTGKLTLKHEYCWVCLSGKCVMSISSAMWSMPEGPANMCLP